MVPTTSIIRVPKTPTILTVSGNQGETGERLQGTGIKKAAKATDLNTWYYTKPTSKRLSNGSVQSCLAIVSAKYQKK